MRITLIHLRTQYSVLGTLPRLSGASHVMVATLALLLACSDTSSRPTGQAVARADSAIRIKRDSTAHIIQGFVEQIRSGEPFRIGDATIASKIVLPVFYERRRFQPAWTDSAAVNDLLRAIRDSRRDGLDPADYHQAELERRVAEVRAMREPKADTLADLDVLLTDALVRLGYHILYGKVDPERLEPDWNLARETDWIDPAQAMDQAIGSGHLYDAIEAYKPQHPFYTSLKLALDHYRAIEAAGGWPTVPPGPSLKPGMTSPRVPPLRQRLAVTSDLDAAAATDTSQVFDDTLKAAVQRFQDRHQLPPDGAVGPETLAALNVPVQQRIDQIRVTLERCRWVLHDLPERFIIVNIAGFKLYVVNGTTPVWETRVQVGKPYRETPIFRSDIKYLVLNPTWTVPPTILQKDVFPAVQKDPSYLSKKGLDVVDRHGEVIDPATLDWSTYTARNFPYQFRQAAGADNALGRIKFIFPNSHSVYLHDTPHRAFFEKTSRSFSSGCIRVEKPLELAEQLLADSVHWSLKALNDSVATEQSRTVFLRPPMPVLILYWTAAVGRDGLVYFLPDVYGRDPAVIKGLNGGFELRKRPVVTGSIHFPPPTLPSRLHSTSEIWAQAPTVSVPGVRGGQTA